MEMRTAAIVPITGKDSAVKYRCRLIGERLQTMSAPAIKEVTNIVVAITQKPFIKRHSYDDFPVGPVDAGRQDCTAAVYQKPGFPIWVEPGTDPNSQPSRLYQHHLPEQNACGFFDIFSVFQR
jgi:hypothetical protein